MNSVAVVRAASARVEIHSCERAQVPAQHGNDRGAEGADTGGFGGREDAAVDAAEHQHEQPEHRPHHAQRAALDLRVERIAGRAVFGIAPNGHFHRAEEQPDQQQAGQHAGDEQLADILLRDDGVDDQRHRGRDHDAERAAGGDRAGGETVAVAVMPHRRDGDLGHGRGGRQRRTADGGKAGAGDHRRERKPAAEAAEAGIGGVVKVAREIGAVDERAHQDEQRDDAQIVVHGVVHDLLPDQRERRAPAAQVSEADQADEHGGEADAQAEEAQQDEDGEAGEGRDHTPLPKSF